MPQNVSKCTPILEPLTSLVSQHRSLMKHSRTSQPIMFIPECWCLTCLSWFYYSSHTYDLKNPPFNYQYILLSVIFPDQIFRYIFLFVAGFLSCCCYCLHALFARVAKRKKFRLLRLGLRQGFGAVPNRRADLRVHQWHASVPPGAARRSIKVSPSLIFFCKMLFSLLHQLWHN